LISSGETTVHVRGRGLGGRNQEFALALAERASTWTRPVVVASVGTDGVDGPTDAAGAIVRSDTLSRAADLRLRPPSAFLADNDAYHFFEPLNDLIRTGPSGTNVGDLQVCLVG
jgi:hydroxypyruvate reductase